MGLFHISDIKRTPLLAALLLPGVAGANANLSQNETLIPASLIEWSYDVTGTKYALLVDKTARQLSVWQYSNSNELFQKVAEFPTDIGKKDGDKLRTGDHRTPEGVYFLQDRLQGNTLNFDLYGSLAFTTDYPNLFDRLAGKTGYGIWLHAIPDQVPLTRGSRGCVVVRNDVIQQLDQYIRTGQTPIFIYDKVPYITPDQTLAKRTSIHGFIENWKSAWQSKDTDSYINYYSDSFKSLGMNKKQWYRHKSNLNNLYSNIQVNFSKPSTLAYKGQYIVKLVQNYSSDKYSDVGVKTLYVEDTASGFKIVGEDWKPLANSTASANATVGNQAAN